ncbi:MerR family DNA-binding transcriptional regulator [Acidisphaera sp. L21]|uniref:MerR family transcriptional regulator n=1 Tax=Acidisphaera sp. L21 TaxID=1641851 RepID=UPI0020B15206|nr:MerR family DNA-binding transcriptional regulator [Acidisphaera sp. L21]
MHALVTPPEPERLFTVSALAAELGVTARTLRFYEDRGLIAPRRLGTTRVYAARDRARMVLILRGKSLGFSLREIAEYLALYKADATGAEQLRALDRAVTASIQRLEQQRTALAQTLAELHELSQQTKHQLAERVE